MRLEFIVLGTPVSNQASGPKGTANLAAWRAQVKGEAQKVWTKAPLTGELKAIIINFHPNEDPSLDIDNMSKPIFDVVNDLVYEDDRQIRQGVDLRFGEVTPRPGPRCARPCWAAGWGVAALAAGGSSAYCKGRVPLRAGR